MPKKEGEWEWVILDKLGLLESGKPLSMKVGDSEILFRGGNVPLIDGQAISDSKSNRYFNQQGVNQNKLFPPHTVCFVRCGSVGDCSILKENACLTESIYAFSFFEGISDPKFIKYCFDFPKIKQKILHLSNTTTRNILSFQKLQLIKFPCPPRRSKS
ncbi:similar restriction modification system DNA specificity domain protein [Mycoplasma suis KI3806]|uniref:Similar restriction modification system DNA specificity domain protein n=1 Tax=Mycoplasma suis (strain KI_3806) TaxID=708248 RepID=F0V395_MYCS3|nr:restriction endonuclease subunit S [Mycoplasma suis]CBZ40317.1 similar restriction modification system DNA specificity domain protein [Mycoplasma suis KI3806]